MTFVVFATSCSDCYDAMRIFTGTIFSLCWRSVLFYLGMSKTLHWQSFTYTDLNVLWAEVSNVAWVSLGEMQTERSHPGMSPGGQRRGSKLCSVGEKAAGQQWLILSPLLLSAFVLLTVCSNFPYGSILSHGFWVIFYHALKNGPCFWVTEGLHCIECSWGSKP